MRHGPGPTLQSQIEPIWLLVLLRWPHLPSNSACCVVWLRNTEIFNTLRLLFNENYCSRKKYSSLENVSFLTFLNLNLSSGFFFYCFPCFRPLQASWFRGLWAQFSGSLKLPKRSVTNPAWSNLVALVTGPRLTSTPSKSSINNMLSTKLVPMSQEHS